MGRSQLTVKMRLFAFALIAAVTAESLYDDLGQKGNKNKGNKNQIEEDKGPRECKGVKIEDTATTKYKCKSRKADQKNRHLSKRCKVQCGKSKNFTGTKKVYSTPRSVGFSARATPQPPLEP